MRAYADNATRVKNRKVLVPLLEQIFRSRTTADWLERLRAADVPAAPVNNVDAAFAEPPVKEREMIVEYDHPQVGKVRLPGNPIKMSGMERHDFKPGADAGRTHRCRSEDAAASFGRRDRGLARKRRARPNDRRIR